MLDKNKQVGCYWLVDVLNSVYKILEPTDEETLETLAMRGFAFVAEYTDGERDVVQWNEVDFDLLRCEVHIVEQEVFVPILEALLELMDDSMTPAIALIGNSGGVKKDYTKFRELATEAIERYKPNLEGE